MAPAKSKPFVDPPRWDAERLKADRVTAIEEFRSERMREPLEEYLDRFEEARDAFEELMEETVDLTQLSERAVDVLTNPSWAQAVRYLSGPPISKDDLTVLAEASLAAKRLRSDPAMAARVIETIRLGLDRQRFPWLALDEHREASEEERKAAILASAALIATQRVATVRRNIGKTTQEARVRQELINAGLKEVRRRIAQRLEDTPKPGEFCMESLLGTRKADLLVGLWDGRSMPIECKVSNSSTNSIKRLNNDAAVKAKVWIGEFGGLNVVPTAVLSGVFPLNSLESAQRGGLTLFWGHNLDALAAWIDSTRVGLGR